MEEVKAVEWLCYAAMILGVGFLIAIADNWVDWLKYAIGIAAILCIAIAGMIHKYDSYKHPHDRL